MAVAAGFLDSLSVFAAVGLCALAVGTLIWLTFEQASKRRVLRRVDVGLRDLTQVTMAIEVHLMHARAHRRLDGLELFLLAATRDIDQPEPEIAKWRARQIGVALGVDNPDGFAEASGRLTKELHKSPPRTTEILGQLNRARRALGTAPVTAVDLVLGRDPWTTRAHGAAVQVADLLQRCDRMERLLFDLPVEQDVGAEAAPVTDDAPREGDDTSGGAPATT